MERIEIETITSKGGDIIQEAKGPRTAVSQWFFETTKANPGSMGELFPTGNEEARAFVRFGVG